jgi:hypothetical protein
MAKSDPSNPKKKIGIAINAEYKGGPKVNGLSELERNLPCSIKLNAGSKYCPASAPSIKVAPS